MHSAGEAFSAGAISVSYFDGVSARAHAALVQIDGDELVISGEGIGRRVALRDLQWPERTRHGIRAAHIRGGGSIQCSNAAAWDAWSHESGQQEPVVVRAQQSWRWVMLAMLVLVCLIVALQQWGLPVASQAIVAVLPPSIDQTLGETAIDVVDERLMRPSALSLGEQTRLRASFSKALAAVPADRIPPWRLLFRKSRIGPNAFALPGGTLVMTDELVELVAHDDKVITAVLAHEMGHVRHRHGLRMLVQATALSGLASVVLGDFSTVLAGVPVLLGQASYSRAAEREADADAVDMLKAASISPDVMVTLFERLDEQRRRDLGAKDASAKGASETEQDGDKTSREASPMPSWLGIAFASHPADAERILFFKDAARR